MNYGPGTPPVAGFRLSGVIGGIFCRRGGGVHVRTHVVPCDPNPRSASNDVTPAPQWSPSAHHPMPKRSVAPHLGLNATRARANQ